MFAMESLVMSELTILTLTIERSLPELDRQESRRESFILQRQDGQPERGRPAHDEVRSQGGGHESTGNHSLDPIRRIGRS